MSSFKGYLLVGKIKTVSLLLSFFLDGGYKLKPFEKFVDRMFKV